MNTHPVITEFRKQKNKKEKWFALALELNGWLKEREISLGYTDTYIGHLASWVQDKIEKGNKEVEQFILTALSKQREEFLGMIEGMTYEDLNKGIEKMGKKISYTGPISQARLDGFQVARRLLREKVKRI